MDPATRFVIPNGLVDQIEAWGDMLSQEHEDNEALWEDFCRQLDVWADIMDTSWGNNHVAEAAARLAGA